jgi:hypothetical protein
MSDVLPIGRMMAPSKSRYFLEHPDHVVVFNAVIFTRTGGKIWYGDLDVTVDGDALKVMAADVGEELYVLRERDGRQATDPPWDKAVARITADTVTIC